MDKLPLSIRLWKCPICQLVGDRNISTSLNIRDFTLADTLGLSAV